MSDLRVERNKLRKRVRRLAGQAIVDYHMIEDGDRVMVCMSGGKDSYVMLDVLLSLQRNAPVSFSVFGINVDQKQPDFPGDVLPDYMAERDVEFHVIEEDTYSIVKSRTPEGKTYCPICSRLRRGILYSSAQKLGATKIALGHHLDDVVETLFLNMFYGSQMKSMPPHLLSDDQRNEVIRPLYYVRESDLEKYAEFEQFPIIPCNLCGSQENLQRQVIKSMLREWDRVQPGRVQNIARSIRNVKPSHLGDSTLFHFDKLTKSEKVLPFVELRA
ncbi:MAG: tRNA 2-thiocytidine(32) synthetase TtcA [Gammaproteobacteria bacterium]|nr:tRNA 2-thiocytidine(32) synthetase TtcA [Gammaproteobacteria bacterium]